MPLLNIQQTAPGILVFQFPKSATTRELDPLFGAIEAKLQRLADGMAKVVFDLAVIDPVRNNAGRVLDMARDARARLLPKDLQVEMLLPHEVYEDLRRTDDLPEPTGSHAVFEGIEFILSDNTLAAEEPRKILATYTGKIREINADKVTVSLFAEEEIVGEFDKRQFPSDALEVGQVFQYQTVIRDRGKTEILLLPMPEAEMTSDELLDLWNVIKVQVPDDA
jgi:hypothetical protein